MPEKLAIAIPTYNRVAALSANLPLLLEEAEKLGVVVYVSDDSADNETQQLANSLLARYSNLRYRRNIPALRHDSNILRTLAWPDADYVWVLGDVFRPKEGELTSILDFLDDQDFVFVNWKSGDPEVISRAEGEAADRLLLSKLWHQTLTGATIFHRPVITWAEASLTKTHANFPQLDVILGYAETHAAVIGWFGRKILHSEPKAASYWHALALDVFVDDWVSVITAYPKAVPADELCDVLKSHSASTGLFNFAFLLELARIGHFNRAAFRRVHFWDVMHKSRLAIYAALLPYPIGRFLLFMRHPFKNRS